jgi:hypothetical protein
MKQAHHNLEIPERLNFVSKEFWNHTGPAADPDVSGMCYYKQKMWRSKISAKLNPVYSPD